MNAEAFAIWAVVIGALLTAMALSGVLLKRLPLSAAMLYLLLGVVLGPAGWALMTPHPRLHAAILERVTEVAVLVSLFAAGLKLGLPLAHKHWRMPVRLAFVSMTLTVALVAALGVFGLGLSLGAAILLGGILAPTDPVLASDVQVEHADDRDRLRFCLTGEGGLNDGAAFPFVLLGLGVLGLHDLGAGGWRWLAIDVLWASAAGLGVGATLGALIGKLVVYLRSRHQESVGLDEFLAVGLIAVAYGAAVLVHGYGFLAVFAAGLALQRVKERDLSRDPPILSAAAHPWQAPTGDPRQASANMMCAVQGFNAQIERIAEVAIVLVLGAMLAYTTISASACFFAMALLLVVRPISVWLGLWGAPLSSDQRRLISWFGIRGIGSIYYLMFAITHGLPQAMAEPIIALTLITVTASIIVHGVSVMPLMRLYARRMAPAK